MGGLSGGAGEAGGESRISATAAWHFRSQRAAVEVAPIDKIGGEVAGLGQQPARAEEGVQRVEQAGGDGRIVGGVSVHGWRKSCGRACGSICRCVPAGRLPGGPVRPGWHGFRFAGRPQAAQVAEDRVMGRMPGRIDAAAEAVVQQRRHHPRMEGRMAARLLAGGGDGREIRPFTRRVADDMRQAPGRRRQPGRAWSTSRGRKVFGTSGANHAQHAKASRCMDRLLGDTRLRPGRGRHAVALRPALRGRGARRRGHARRHGGAGGALRRGGCRGERA